MDGPNSKTTGLDRAVARLARLKGLHGLRITIGAKSTTGSKFTGGKKNKRIESVSRTAGDNVIILRTHAKGHKTKQGGKVPARNVGFINEMESSKLLAIMHKAINSVVRRRTPLATFIAAGNKIGQLMIEAYEKHIKQSIGLRGRIKPVADITRKAKERETGKTGLPPLVRSGQLVRSFKIDKVRVVDK